MPYVISVLKVDCDPETMAKEIAMRSIMDRETVGESHHIVSCGKSAIVYPEGFDMAEEFERLLHFSGYYGE